MPVSLPVPTEAQEQIALFSWAAVQDIPELALLYHIPNGGSRHKAEAARLRAEGVPIELADAIIRILDYCGYAGIDIDAAQFYPVFRAIAELALYCEDRGADEL